MTDLGSAMLRATPCACMRIIDIQISTTTMSCSSNKEPIASVVHNVIVNWSSFNKFDDQSSAAHIKWFTVILGTFRKGVRFQCTCTWMQWFLSNNPGFPVALNGDAYSPEKPISGPFSTFSAKNVRKWKERKTLTQWWPSNTISGLQNPQAINAEVTSGHRSNLVIRYLLR